MWTTVRSESFVVVFLMIRRPPRSTRTDTFPYTTLFRSSDVDVSGASPAAAPPKLDPETLAIRSRPPRAIRFKRGVIIAIAAIGSVSLIAVTWVALKPRLFHGVTSQEELSQPNSRAASDVLNGVPASYGDVEIGRAHV